MANQPKKYKKFVATAATATLVASAIVPVASAASLSDIAGNTHEEAITSLVDAGVINGYPDGTFQPNKTLTRSDVVKLLGKYLVSKGLEVPADYKTNVRFNDLTSASNDELLKYAAVVYDAGVFNGSNGNLLAGDNITRENMAVVLVRAFDTLNNIDLVSYVQGQEYKKDVKDLYTAKSEARSAIEVLDFFDITNPAVANFNPKGSTTRGQFATFLYKTINTDFSAVTGVANSAVSEIKAINNTTVEVTFKETVKNIEALDFTIDGLEVKNAVVKQTDAKTVVLTTAAQTGETVYTLNVNAAKAGTFKGVSAVIPTAVTMTTPSVQGKLGQQVTVKAQVTVAEGQSKAGIPVTFSVPGNNNDAVYPTVTGEAVTNAEGVATFTYTRYGAGTDSVTAYATGDRSKFATGYVFWGVDQILSITEVTEGATINNGANKTYKVTYKDPTTGNPVSGKTLNVGVKENIDVTVDKLQNVTINGTAVVQTSDTNTKAAQIKTDSKGEATFTVSGSNAEVTPVVFDATANTVTNSNGTVITTSYSQKYTAGKLQATATKVKFGAVQADYSIELTRDGGEVAATGLTNGRKYNVVVKTKDGKIAANETVNVAFNENIDGIISTTTNAKFVKVENGKQVDWNGDKITVKTNSKGEASFIIGTPDGNVNTYATPIAWIDINNQSGKDANLDKGEPTSIAPITYFQAEYLDGSKLVSKKGTEETDKFDGNDVATFEVKLTNQSGKTVANSGYTTKDVSFTVYNTGSENVKVNGEEIAPNRVYTVIAADGKLDVTSVGGKTTSVKVLATGVAKHASDNTKPDFAFTAKEATATFTSTKEVADTYTGAIVAIDTDEKEVTFAGKSAVSYDGASFKNEFGNVIDEDAFVNLVKGGVTATYLKNTDGKISFEIIKSKQGSTPDLSEAVTESVTLANLNLAKADTAVSSATGIVSAKATATGVELTAKAAGTATVTVTEAGAEGTEDDKVATISVTVSKDATTGELIISATPVPYATPDTTKPTVEKVVVSGTTITLTFSEKVEEASAETVTNYALKTADATDAEKVTVAALGKDGLTLTLVVDAVLANADTLTVSNVKDLANNVIVETEKALTVVTP